MNEVVSLLSWELNKNPVYGVQYIYVFESIEMQAPRDLLTSR